MKVFLKGWQSAFDLIVSGRGRGSPWWLFEMQGVSGEDVRDVAYRIGFIIILCAG